MDQNHTLQLAFNLIKRLPPSNIRKNVAAVWNLIQNQETQSELMSRIDQPLLVQSDTKEGKQFLKCEYNREGKSYRSPWSNQYYPSISDGYYPSPQKRQIEVKLNEIFKIYTGLYYDNAITSVYVWENQEQAVASSKELVGCLLVKKELDNEKGVKSAFWDSIHLFDLKEDSDAKGNPLIKCSLISSVMLVVQSDNEKEYGSMEVAGTINKKSQAKKKASIKNVETVIKLIGQLVEDAETDLLNSIDHIYISKTKQIFNTTRLQQEYMTKDQKNQFYNELKDKTKLYA